MTPLPKILQATVLSCLVAVGAVAQSGGGQAFSLSAAQNYAVENSYTYQNAELDLAASKSKVKEITAIGLPQISGSASFQSFLDIPTQLIPAAAFDPTAPADLYVPVQFGIDNSVAAGVSVNQLIFDGTYIVGLQSAKAYVDLSKKQQDKTAIDIKEAVAQSYYGVLAAEESTRVLGENLSFMEQNLKEMRAIAEQGLMDQTDVDQMSLTVSNVRNTKQALDRQVDVAYRMLKFQMGIDQSTDIALIDKLDDLLGNPNEGALSDQQVNTSSHPDFQLLSVQEDLMALNLKKERYTRMPSLAGYFSYQQNSFSNELSFNDWYPNTVWGLQLNVPIFDFFGTANKIKQADIELQKVRNNKAMLTQSLQLQAEAARAEYQTAFAQYNYEKDNLALADDILKKTIVRQQNGMASSMDVTTANTQFLTTQTNYVNAIVNLLNARVKLNKALGTYK